MSQAQRTRQQRKLDKVKHPAPAFDLTDETPETLTDENGNVLYDG